MRNRAAIGWVMGLAVAMAGSMARADGNIDAASKYAWSVNAGWLNFNPANGGVTVNAAGGYLAGCAWGENVGWVKLGSGTGPYANTGANNWGVNMDGRGNLSGYAWSPNVGWINFHPDNASPVTINPGTGQFAGYAWAENCGWVHFQNASPAYGVKTTPFARGSLIVFR